MRKILLFMVICLLFNILTSCAGTATESDMISRRIDVSVDGGCVEVYTDNHGGFHGDGETYAKIIFSDESFCDAIKQNSEWSDLPLSENLNVVVYGGTLPNGEPWGSFIEDENDQPLIPTISNGYYFFKDRHYESRNRKDDSLIFERYSFNLTLAIYDSDSKVLYFYEIDT